MRPIVKNGLQFIVGRHISLGLFVIPEAEVTESRQHNGFLSAFMMLKDQLVTFKYEGLLKVIDKEVVPESEAVSALEAYVAFKHKDYLLRNRLPQAVLRHSVQCRDESTHCYACKQTLDSSSSLQCSTCKWLVCTCGACGCGYRK